MPGKSDPAIDNDVVGTRACALIDALQDCGQVPMLP